VSLFRLCAEHARKAQLARQKSSRRHVPPPSSESLLLSLSHYSKIDYNSAAAVSGNSSYFCSFMYWFQHLFRCQLLFLFIAIFWQGLLCSRNSTPYCTLMLRLRFQDCNFPKRWSDLLENKFSTLWNGVFFEFGSHAASLEICVFLWIPDIRYCVQNIFSCTLS
jgi:hypothetical protein